MKKARPLILGTITDLQMHLRQYKEVNRKFKHVGYAIIYAITRKRQLRWIKCGKQNKILLSKLEKQLNCRCRSQLVIYDKKS